MTAHQISSLCIKLYHPLPNSSSVNHVRYNFLHASRGRNGELRICSYLSAPRCSFNIFFHLQLALNRGDYVQSISLIQIVNSSLLSFVRCAAYSESHLIGFIQSVLSSGTLSWPAPHRVDPRVLQFVKPFR